MSADWILRAAAGLLLVGGGWALAIAGADYFDDPRFAGIVGALAALSIFFEKSRKIALSEAQTALIEETKNHPIWPYLIVAIAVIVSSYFLYLPFGAADPSDTYWGIFTMTLCVVLFAKFTRFRRTKVIQ